jgi:hypothetical protein
MYVPVAASALFGAGLYFFVMPQLTGFIGLGLVIFATTFAICYLFAEPQQALGRTFGLALFLVIASISNEQTYNFLSVAVTAQMFAIIFIILAATAYFPFRLTPNRVFLRLLGRYFRSSEYLISAAHTGLAPARSGLARWRHAFHDREVATLPAKLRVWAPHIDNWVLSGSTPEQINRLLDALQSLTFRIQQALKECETPQASFLMESLRDDFCTWHEGLYGEFRRLAKDPVLADEHEALRARLSAKLEHLESRIEGVLNATPVDHFRDEEAENFYRLLDAYRGVSQALIDFKTTVGGIDWTRWQEERFA